ncbi:MAG: phosphoadenylyl-sulfate reductase [Robiginitomaculum sp.]|nr:phosphoadenylyl-sulfate reductase [Robiginitomaculum sp.]
MTDINERALGLSKALACLPAPERLAELCKTMGKPVGGRSVFTTSFGMEDQIITHMICDQDLDIDIVTLDTGRMFEETYTVWAATEKTFGRAIKGYVPDAGELETLVAKQGINGIFVSVDQRKACCTVRKIVPLGRALQGASLWVTGIRAEQSQARGSVNPVEADNVRGLLKASPLYDWTVADMDTYLKTHSDIPLNVLHKQNFPSIGCAPCTRAVKSGEDDRAGRWWWEDGQQECGLHVGADGRLVRTKPTKEVL